MVGFAIGKKHAAEMLRAFLPLTTPLAWYRIDFMEVVDDVLMVLSAACSWATFLAGLFTSPTGVIQPIYIILVAAFFNATLVACMAGSRRKDTKNGITWGNWKAQ